MHELIGYIEGEILEVMQTEEGKDLDLYLRLVYENGTVRVTFREKEDRRCRHNTKDRRI
jgi:hypothetical protein